MKKKRKNRSTYSRGFLSEELGKGPPLLKKKKKRRNGLYSRWHGPLWQEWPLQPANYTKINYIASSTIEQVTRGRPYSGVNFSNNNKKVFTLKKTHRDTSYLKSGKKCSLWTSLYYTVWALWGQKFELHYFPISKALYLLSKVLLYITIVFRNMQ